MALFVVVFITQEPKVDGLNIRAMSRLASWGIDRVAQPQAVVFGQPVFVIRDAKHVDVLVSIKNPNNIWGAAKLRYHLVVDHQAQPVQETFLNPGEEWPVVQLNIPVASAQPSIEAVFDDVSWARAGDAALPSAQFSVEAPTITPTTVTVGGRSISTVAVNARVTNTSVFNFYRVDMPVVVSNGGTVVALDILSVTRWTTLTPQTVAVTWSYPVAAATSATILPHVSRFDRDNVYR